MSCLGHRGPLLVLLATIVFGSMDGLAAGSAEEAREVLSRGTIEMGLAVGYWQATTLVGTNGS
jgi:hypothetical protein